jgi:hypothetical protein
VNVLLDYIKYLNIIRIIISIIFLIYILVKFLKNPKTKDNLTKFLINIINILLIGLIFNILIDIFNSSYFNILKESHNIAGNDSQINREILVAETVKKKLSSIPNQDSSWGWYIRQKIISNFFGFIKKDMCLSKYPMPINSVKSKIYLWGGLVNIDLNSSTRINPIRFKPVTFIPYITSKFVPSLEDSSSLVIKPISSNNHIVSKFDPSLEETPYWFIKPISSYNHLSPSSPYWYNSYLAEGFRLQAHKVHIVMDKLDMERPEGLAIYEILKRELYFFFKDESERLDIKAWKMTYREIIYSEPRFTINDFVDIDSDYDSDSDSDRGTYMCGMFFNQPNEIERLEGRNSHESWLNWIL